MRICPITVSQARNYQNYKVQHSQKMQSPGFKGAGGVFGSIGGALLGLGLTALSGGALAWTIPALSGSGAIGGDMYEKKDKPSTDSYGQ